mgnify:CR=1 FL=1
MDFDNGVYHKFAYKHQPHVERLSKNEIKLTKQEVPLEEVYESVNEQVVKEMVGKYVCWPADYIRNCISKNLNNYCTATYYLI